MHAAHVHDIIKDLLLVPSAALSTCRGAGLTTACVVLWRVYRETSYSRSHRYVPLAGFRDSHTFLMHDGDSAASSYVLLSIGLVCIAPLHF